MYVVHRAEHEDAGPGAQHAGGQGGAGAHHVPLQAPGDCYCDTTHISCANVPESTTGDQKENGTILGGSKMILGCQISLFLRH